MADWGNFDEIELLQVARSLRTLFAQHTPHGYLRGKVALANALEQVLEYSDTEAEELVDLLEARGWIRFEGTPGSDDDAGWHIDGGRVGPERVRQAEPPAELWID